MKLTIELSEEEVRGLIEKKVMNEASKHGHADTVERRIGWCGPTGRDADGQSEGHLRDLSTLKVEVVAEIATK